VLVEEAADQPSLTTFTITENQVDHSQGSQPAVKHITSSVASTEDTAAPLCIPEIIESSDIQILAESTVQTDKTDEASHSSTPQTATVTLAEPVLASSEQHVSEAQPDAISSTDFAALVRTKKQPSTSSFLTPAFSKKSTLSSPSSYKRTPPFVPLYTDLRKLPAAHSRETKKPGWIIYIYRSFIKPVVSVTLDCTVAVLSYSLTKVLEARPPVLGEATSWIV